MNRFRSFFASLCFHLLESAPVLPWAPPPDKHVTGVGFSMASWAHKICREPSVPGGFYVEPRVPIWSTDLADVAAVGGSWGQQFLACHMAGPL
jgi:hypothetical protein